MTATCRNILHTAIYIQYVYIPARGSYFIISISKIITTIFFSFKNKLTVKLPPEAKLFHIIVIYRARARGGGGNITLYTLLLHYYIRRLEFYTKIYIILIFGASAASILVRAFVRAKFNVYKRGGERQQQQTASETFIRLQGSDNARARSLVYLPIIYKRD